VRVDGDRQSLATEVAELPTAAAKRRCQRDTVALARPPLAGPSGTVDRSGGCRVDSASTGRSPPARTRSDRAGRPRVHEADPRASQVRRNEMHRQTAKTSSPNCSTNSAARRHQSNPFARASRTALAAAARRRTRPVKPDSQAVRRRPSGYAWGAANRPVGARTRRPLTGRR
jgi:hypothetical protein